MTLLKGENSNDTQMRILRYSISFVVLVFIMIWVIFNSFNKRTPKKEKRNIFKIKISLKYKRLLSGLIVLYSLTFLLIAPTRPIDELNYPTLKNILFEIFRLNKLKTQRKNILPSNKLISGSFKKQTGLENLIPGKTNVIFILLESTSYKYLQNSKNSQIVFPYLSQLRKSSHAINVEYFYSNVPHSSASRTAIMTGNYIRPDRVFRKSEKYTGDSLISALKTFGYNSYYTHTCDLKFENQRPYFKKLGLNVLDGVWFEKQNNNLKTIGWGHDDMELINMSFNYILKKKG